MMKVYDRIRIDRWSLAVIGAALLVVSGAGVVYGGRAAMASRLSCRAQYGSPPAGVEQILAWCREAYALYPWNYYFSIFAAEAAYYKADEVRGDARRNELWAGCFCLVDGIVGLKGDWVVATADQIPDRLMAEGSVWVTADWNRMGSVLEARCPRDVMVVKEPRLPRAGMVAHVAEELAARRMEGEPLAPIYVHPAVSVAPRF